MDALREHLGVPPSLRVCFALEVARLQLTLLLFGRQSITCDRNCEGGLPGKKGLLKICLGCRSNFLSFPI
jgi:hypothetical protein